MTLLFNTFEGGTNGVTLTQGSGGNTGDASGSYFDAVSIGTGCVNEFSSAQKYQSLAGRFATRGTAATSYVGWTTRLGSYTDAYGRAYMYIDAASVPAITQLVQIRDPSAVSAFFRIGTDAKLTILDSASVVQATSTNAVNLQSWVRLEWHEVCNTSTGSLTIRIYNNPDSSTVTEEFAANNINTLAAADRILMGIITPLSNWPSTTGFLYLDYLAMGDTSWLGPALPRSTTTTLANPDTTFWITT